MEEKSLKQAEILLSWFLLEFSPYLTLPLQIPNLFLLKFHVQGKLLTLGL